MKNRFALVLFVLLSLLAVSANAQQRFASRDTASAKSVDSASLQELVNQAAHTALTKFADKKLTENQLAITLIDLRNPQHPVTASFRGHERIYPASVVKLFYLVCRLLLEKKNESCVYRWHR